jgi:hypothetical protein
MGRIGVHVFCAAASRYPAIDYSFLDAAQTPVLICREFDTNRSFPGIWSSPIG